MGIGVNQQRPDSTPVDAGSQAVEVRLVLPSDRISGCKKSSFRIGGNCELNRSPVKAPEDSFLFLIGIGTVR